MPSVKFRMFTFIEVSRRRSHSHSFSVHQIVYTAIKSKAKQTTESVKVESILCEEAEFLWSVIVV